MRNLAVLTVWAVCIACFWHSAQAQNFATNSSQSDAVVYTLELTDQMIEDLRNGQSLKSEIPPNLRNRVTEVRLRYLPSSRTGAPATRGSGHSTRQSASSLAISASTAQFQVAPMPLPRSPIAASPLPSANSARIGAAVI